MGRPLPSMPTSAAARARNLGGRPYKGKREVLRARIPVDANNAANQLTTDHRHTFSDTVATLVTIGLDHISEFEDAWASLAPAVVTNAGGELYMTNTDALPLDLIWARVPHSVDAQVREITATMNADGERAGRTHVYAALILVGLRHADQYEQTYPLMQAAALNPAGTAHTTTTRTAPRGVATHAIQGVLDIAI